MIGRTLSHYRIIQKLGEGGMGVVYRAHDESLDRDVALKVLPEEVAQNPERLVRFAREAKTVATLNHPNIVTIFSVEEVDGVHFITMEMVEGRTLSELLTPKGFSLDRLFDLAIPLADAVNSAHSKGVAHRDLKPANIMIDHEGRVKILDFGLAKLFDPAIGPSIPADGHTIDMPSSPTVEGKILGTPDYMSPEQAEGKPVDHRSDLFSLGIILYEMTTGHRPFRGDSPVATISSILRDTPVAVTDLRSELPNHLGRIIGNCLAKRQDRRYQSALDLRNDLAGLKRETESEHLGNAGDNSKRNRSWPRGLMRPRTVVLAIVVVGVLALGFWQFWPDGAGQDASEDSDRKMLVVLPFENLGLPEDQYFADGITEEITARLAGVRDLGVIARTIAIQYKDTNKTLKEIGKELGVGYVLAGTIRWQRISDSENQVRVTPQLIQLADATQLWADFYQEGMSDIFQVQSDIAEQVVSALDVALMETERKNLTSRPTDNIEAYHAYLRGLEYYRHPSDTDEYLPMALQLFSRAVELDPDFALAYCKMAEVHAALYHFHLDRTSEGLALAEKAVDKALALQPDLPEAHLALGWYYYWGFMDYDLALSEFSIAAEGLPNNAETHAGRSSVMRRQGRWDIAIDHHFQACELDPQHSDYHGNAGFSLMITRRYAEAEPFFDRSILLAPDQNWVYVAKAQMQCLWKGDVEGALAVLRNIPDGIDINTRLYVEVEIIGRDYPAILERLKALPTDFVEYPYYTIPKALYIGLIYWYMGDTKRSTDAFESALTILAAMAKDQPSNWSLQSSLGIAYAGLGRKDEALKAGQAATEIFPLKGDAAEGYDPLIYLAQIYTMVGEYVAALDQIEYLLKIPSEISVPILRLDPRWDPLRDHPRFQRVVR